MSTIPSAGAKALPSRRNHLIAMAVLLVLLILLPLVFRTPYVQHLVIMFFYTASASIAWNIIGGFGGQMSLGHAVFLGIGAYSSAVVQSKFNMIPLVGFILGVILSVAFSFIVFYPCFKLRGPYFTMATLAISLTLLNLFLNWDYIGKAEGILIPFKNTPDFWWFQFNGKLPFYYLILIVFLGFLGITRYVQQGKIGYALLTIKQNEQTAISIGINNPMMKSYAVMISAAMMSILGSFYFQYIRYIDPEIFLVYHSVDIVLPAIIGGLGTVFGPVLGTLIIFPLTELLRASIGVMLSGSHYVVIALIMIIMVLIKPEGLNSSFMNLYEKVIGKFGRRGKESNR